MRTLYLTALSLFLSAPAMGGMPAWDPSGVPVCSPECTGSLFHVVSDGQGGAYVAWRDERPSASTRPDLYLQHLSETGEIAAGWPPDGLPIAVFPNTQSPITLALDADGSVFVIWLDRRTVGTTGEDIYAQKILPDGTISPGWPPGGSLVADDPGHQSFFADAAPDGVGGVYIVWRDERDFLATGLDIYMQRLTAQGDPAPGWPAAGLPACRATEDQGVTTRSILLTSDGGVIGVWADCRNLSFECDQSFGQRFLPDGILASGWSVDGRLLSDGSTVPNIVSDHAGGFYLVTGEFLPGTLRMQNILVHRFSLDGSILPEWPTGGLQACCPEPASSREKLRVVEDGFGGVLITWYDNTLAGQNVYATRALPDGSIAPGWPPSGVLVSDPTTNDSWDQEMIADGEGGAFMVYQWNGFKGRVQHLTPTGEVEVGWPPYGLTVASTASHFTPKIASDGVGGAIVVWEERGGTGSRLGLFAQRFVDDEETQTRPSLVSTEAEDGVVTLAWYAKSAAELQASVERRTEYGPWDLLGAAVPDGPDGLRYEDRSVTAGERYAYRLGYMDEGSTVYTAEAWVSVPSDLRFALQGFAPNPAVGPPVVSLTLPRTDAARLEVFDLRGRLVLRRDLSGLGAGKHAVSLDDGVRLAPGVYVLRLTQGDQVARVRGVILD